MDRLRRFVPRISRRRLKPQPEADDTTDDAHDADYRKPQPLDLLPTLPPTRRPITAVPSSVTSHSEPTATTFLTLPYELRHQIYLLLLASRPGLHIDMRYAQASGHPHTTEGAYFHDERWAWRASTCHRDPSIHAAFDRCGLGGPPPTACHLHPDTTCGIGAEVLGLLLTCRQVYREAVQVLYARNTFYITTGSLILYTNRLLVPETAVMITSLVFTITTNTCVIFAREQLGLKPGWDAYAALLRRIPGAFPGLKKLSVIALTARRAMLEWRWPTNNNIFDVVEAPPEDRVVNEEVKKKLLGYMDEAVLAYGGGQLRECEIVFEKDVFDKYMGGDFAEAERREGEDGTDFKRYWRQLPVMEKDWDLDEVEKDRCGYWVQRVPKLFEVWFDMTVDYSRIA
ncbi:hypothetical protein B0T20DRAFT_50176 [Sordaria brevicollis]|uniref:DUF7730 domain-containing protein n=1 Tax=Sordaria brevicollis TaxID=83679 RepID=A0AAE0P2R9_SORBR|nr:hypothetical protein B0T20DRAFT_50176 [Sordaria brevicollis]